MKEFPQMTRQLNWSETLAAASTSLSCFNESDCAARALRRRGTSFRVMTLHVPFTWPGEASHRIIWPWVDMFALTSPEDHQPLTSHPPTHTHFKPPITRISTLFKQIPVTGCCCQSHHPTSVRSCLIQPPREERAHLRGLLGALRSDTLRSERAETAACVQGSGPGWCDELLLMLSLTESKKEGMDGQWHWSDTSRASHVFLFSASLRSW